MPEFNTGLPSIRKLQGYIQEKATVELKLLTGDLLDGQILWQDQNCFCLQSGDGKSILVWYHAIAYIRPKG
ncbi:MAG: Hfq-related RNA-binding protein [Limnospira sp.]